MRAGLQPIFLRLAPPDIALVKFLFESYEGVAIVRTLDKRAAIIVALVSEDFLDVARGILASLRCEIALEEIPPPACAAAGRPDDARDDWLLRVLWQDEPQEKPRY